MPVDDQHDSDLIVVKTIPTLGASIASYRGDNEGCVGRCFHCSTSMYVLYSVVSDEPTRCSQVRVVYSNELLSVALWSLGAAKHLNEADAEQLHHHNELDDATQKLLCISLRQSKAKQKNIKNICSCEAEKLHEQVK